MVSLSSDTTFLTFSHIASINILSALPTDDAIFKYLYLISVSVII